MGPKRGLYAKRSIDVPQSIISSPEECAKKAGYRHPLGEDMVLAALVEEEENINGDTEAALPKIELSTIPSLQKALTLPRSGNPEPTKAGRLGERRVKMPTTTLHPPPMIKSSKDELGAKKPQTPVTRKASHGTGENSPGMKTPRASGPQTAARPHPIFPLRKRLRSALNPDGPSLMDNREERGRDLKTRDLINQDIAIAITGGGNNMLGRLILARISALEEGMMDIKDILNK